MSGAKPQHTRHTKYSKFCQILIESVVLVRLCIYRADYDLVEMETYWRIKYCTIRLLYGIWITSNPQVLG